MEAKKSTPGPLPFSPQLQSLSLGLMGIGVVTFAFMLFKNSDRAWHAYLAGYFFFFVIAIGGLFFAAVQHLTKAGWSVNVRRFAEAFTAYLPVAGVGALLLVIGGPKLYEWMHKSEVAHDALLAHKSGYLNTPFFAIRILVFFVLWLLYRSKLVGFSLEQDKTGDDSLTHRAVTWSTSFMLVFALSFSMFSVDLLMSLQPHWFSTIFGIYCFGGLFQATMASMILLILHCRSRGMLDGYVDENHMHDLGKFLFAFTVFWAYIAYSQYMLIWYANLPEETIFYLPRVTGAWTYVSAGLILFKFIVPFLALLSRRAKRNMAMLTAVSVLILVMEYVDIYWLIYPNMNKSEVVFGLPEIFIFCGFAGVFLFTTLRFLSQHPIVPLKDPRIGESLHHHVVY